jgi:probable HAF family extracellular repeat protein
MDDVAAATRYVATRIPQQGYYNTSADAINSKGAIAGNATRYTDDYGDEADVAAFIFSPSNEVTPIAMSGFAARAYGINSRGEVVGAFVVNGHAHAFRYADGMIVEVSRPGAMDSLAMATNERGDVAGTQDSRAFVIDADGRAVVLGGESYATAINVFGEFAGYLLMSRVGNRPLYHAFRYRDGAIEDLGALGDFAFAFGINASGDVVGETFGSDNIPRPFLYTAGAMRYLGEEHGAAQAINAAGTVVGYQFGDRGDRPFIYSDGGMANLAELVDGLDGAKLVSAAAINDAGQIAGRACLPGPSNQCFGVRLDPAPVPPVRAVEFHHSEMDHYFVTANPVEIGLLDDGSLAGWTRTGEGFNVQPGPQVGTAPVCRLFSTAFAPKSSHFYTSSTTECAMVKRSPYWQFEGIVFYVATPDASGECPSETVPVYRLYNDGQGAAPNHRYTTSPSSRQQMIDRGWIAEGSGLLGVTMCVAS